jgi:hypothetical protein
MAALGFMFDASEVARPCSYADLPDIPAIARLKSRRQWVCWRYEDRGGPKPTKVPYQPLTGFKASASKPAQWGTYDQAVARAERGRFDGVGFCLSEDDDLTGIDLDHCRDPNTGELSPMAQQIVDLGETYCEVTPSESGLRIIAEGKIAAALKRDPVGVEMYGRGRYLTITGWHLAGTPAEVRPAERTVEILREAVARYDAENAPKPEAGALVATGAVSAALPVREDGGSPFFRNVNGAALDALHTWVPAVFGASARFHPGTGAFRVSSKALGRNLEEDLSIAPNGIRDWGVGDMGDPRLGARTPIDLVIEFGFERDPLAAGRWLCQQMGKDPESFGWEEGSALGSEIATTLLARQVQREPDGTLIDAETGEIVQADRVEIAGAQDFPDDALRLPGLIGELADWIMATSMFPCRLFATAAAITAVGGAVGRQVYTGVPRSSTSLYWLTIAPTGGGKDWPQEAVKAVYRAAGLGHILKSAVSSSAKLGMTLAEQPAQIQIIDEVGKVLRKFVSRNSSSQEMSLLDDYCSVWGKNMGSFEPEGVTTRTDTVIHRPCLTFYGATTPTNFFSQLRSAQVAGGFLNRFLVLQRHQRVEPVENPVPADDVPPMFVEALQTLRTWQDGKQLQAYSTLADDSERPPPAFIVPATPEAEALMKEAQVKARAMVIQSDHDPVLEVYARAAEMVKRMAAILACGRHWRNMAACRIEAQDVTFASNLVEWSMASFVEGLRNHMAENEHQANAKMVLDIIRKGKGREVSRSDLYRRVDNRIQARELSGIIANLVEAGSVEIIEERPPTGSRGGRPKTAYVYKREK